jgi:general secretion pathway protein G
MQEFFDPRNKSIFRWLTGTILSGSHNRKWWTRGFTLAELIIVITIMGILSSIGLSVYKHFIDRARNTRAVAEIRLLDKEIIGFLNSNDRLPDRLAEIGRENILDPWKSFYKYINFETAANAEETWRTKGKESKGKGKGKGLEKDSPLNTEYDLYSMGKDRMSVPALEDEASKDDIIRAADGSYLGLASEY